MHGQQNIKKKTTGEEHQLHSVDCDNFVKLVTKLWFP